MFRRRREPILPPTWVLVGLGNPGPEYARTRHNVGFEVIERLATLHRIRLDQRKHQSLYGVGTIGDTSVVLLKPMTYMNLSGRAVAQIARTYQIPPDRLLVIADDLDLPVGKTRMRLKGSSGGHNGHKSIIQALGTEEYPRIKIGIGRPGDQTIDHVLSRFHPNERVDVERAIERSATSCELALANGMEAAMNFLNSGS